VRLGLLWAAATLAALVAGRSWLALWLAPAAALAAAGLARSWYRQAGKGSGAGRRRNGPRARPPAELAALMAAGVVLAAAAGPVPALAVAVLVAGLLGRPAAGRPPATSRSRGATPDAPGPVRSGLIALAPAAAGAGLVLTRGQSFTSALVLAGMVSAYDASAYLIGTGARHGWAGPAAGMASIAALSLFVAAVLAPPFRGATPWIMGGLAAVLAPLGPRATSRLHRPRSARLPAAAGRLDSLVLLGPAWALTSALLLRS
jgi:hypothetical protein